MVNTKKYKTEEERENAKKVSRRKYYLKKKKWILEKQRVYIKKIKSDPIRKLKYLAASNKYTKAYYNRHRDAVLELQRKAYWKRKHGPSFKSEAQIIKKPIIIEW